MSYGDHVRFVNGAGEFDDLGNIFYYGFVNSGIIGVRPALNLKSDTLVSEIRK